MKKLITTVILAAAIVSCNKNGGGTSLGTVSNLENDDQKAGYAYGMNVGEQVLNYSETMVDNPLNFELIEKGLNDYFAMDKAQRESYATGQNIGISITGFLKSQKLEGTVEEKYIVQGIMDVIKKNKTLMAKEEIDGFMNQYLQGLAEKKTKENTQKGADFLAEKAKDSKIKSTPSGLLYEVIQEGNGATPTINSVVEVNYVGKTIDGNTFDESKGNPIKFPLANVIQGWQEGLQLMKVGSKYKLYIPSELGYAQYGTPDGKIGPNEVLIFDVELISVEDQTPAQP